MKNIKLLTLTMIVAIIACNNGQNQNGKEALLQKYQSELAELQKKISDLEKELALESGESNEFLASVGIDTIKLKAFESKFSFQAVVESEKNVMLSSENPGLVNQIHVKEGQQVAKGQLLVSLDASLFETQMAEINKALELSENIYQKQKRLWEQNIGTELQYLEAKNRYESLQKQKNSLQVRIAKFNIRAPFSAKVDAIATTVGSMISPGMPLIRLVDDTNIKVVAQVPESYIGKIKAGDEVEVRYPGIKVTTKEKVHSVSRVINPDNRTFQIFIRPTTKNGFELKPNLLAVITAVDFRKDEVITVPTQIIKRDFENKTFVFTVMPSKEAGFVVERRFIEIDRFDTDNSIISSGLLAGDLIITKGYNSVDDKDKVRIN